MKRNTEFHDYVVHDVLGHIDGVTSRGMFGGFGLYLDGTIFGIITGGTLYFKVDETNKAEYLKLGSQPFAYDTKKGKKVSLSYFEVPEEVMNDRERIHRFVTDSAIINERKKDRS